MAKVKRVKRKELSKTIKDLTIPISIEQMGTKEDPCFGKLHDPRESECKRCGDAEICAIAMGQKNHLLRAKVEAEGNFKDMEEVDIKPDTDKKVLRKSIKNRIRDMVRRGGGKYVDIDEIVHDVLASYAKDGFKELHIKRMIDKIAETSDKIILHQNKLKWKSQKS